MACATMGLHSTPVAPWLVCHRQSGQTRAILRATHFSFPSLFLLFLGEVECMREVSGQTLGEAYHLPSQSLPPRSAGL